MNYHNAAGWKVLPIAPRQPFNRQRKLPAILLIRVGVIAAIETVNHHQVIFVGLLVLAEAAIPLHIPLANNINVLASVDHHELPPQNPLVLIAIQPQHLAHWNVHQSTVNVERLPLRNVFRNGLAHRRFARTAIRVHKQRPRLRQQTWNQILERC